MRPTTRSRFFLPELRLLPDWRRVLRKAWSVRLILLAGLLSGIEAVLPFFIDNVPTRAFRLATFVITVAALVARLVAQEGLTDGRQD